MNEETTLELMDKLINANIDVEATMENAFLGDCGDKTLAIYPIVDDRFTPIRNYGDEFDAKILEDLSDEGIYVSLGYINDMDVGIDSNTITEIENLEDVIEELEIGDDIFVYELRTSKDTVTYATDVNFPCDMCTNYGVKITTNGDNYDLEFCLQCGGPTCWSTPSISLFKEDSSDDWVDISNNSLNQLLVELMFKCIVFN